MHRPQTLLGPEVYGPKQALPFRAQSSMGLQQGFDFPLLDRRPDKRPRLTDDIETLDPGYGFQPMLPSRSQQQLGYFEPADGRFYTRPRQYFKGFDPVPGFTDVNHGCYVHPFDAGNYNRYYSPSQYHYPSATASASPPRQRRRVSYGDRLPYTDDQMIPLQSQDRPPSMGHKGTSHTATLAHPSAQSSKLSKD